MADSLIEFIALTGEAGAGWVAEYRPRHHIVEMIYKALALLKAQNLERAAKILERADQIQTSTDMPASIRGVVEDAYHRVSGLYYYRLSDYDRAMRSMEMAQCAMVRIIGSSDFLMPFAAMSPALYLNKARVARKQGKWAEMHGQVNLLRAMLAGTSPLYVDPDGREVFYATIRGFLQSLDLPKDAVVEEMSTLVDESQLEPAYDAAIRGLLRSEAPAIDYTPLSMAS